MKMNQWQHRTGWEEMIEITCTPTEKRRLEQALLSGMADIADAACLFPRKAAHCAVIPESDCKKCIRTKIKWNVVDRKAGQKPERRKTTCENSTKT